MKINMDEINKETNELLKKYPELDGHIIQSLLLYKYAGIKPGGFLEAVLSNNLEEAFGRADFINVRRVDVIVKFIVNDMPYGCHGSAENFKYWVTNNGLYGLEELTEQNQ
jgi:hypothetical protein